MGKLDEAIDHYRELSAEIGDLEEMLDVKKKQMLYLTRTVIPGIMAELDMAKATLSDGAEIVVKSEINVKQVDKSALAKWLDAHGHGDIVKTELIFGKGEVDQELIEELRSEGKTFEVANEVHWKTLQKVIKDHIEAGGAVGPDSGMEIEYFDHATVKEKK